MVRAKFQVAANYPQGDSHRVILTAVVAGEENAGWAAATPAGLIDMHIRNNVAAEFFQPGKVLGLEFFEV